jgi:hypothetical protein
MTRTADVLIQAGHEGRTSGATGAAANGLREIELTPRVADAATVVLRDAGLTVLRDPAATTAAKVKVAVAFHFDGPPQAGAQFLFDDPTDQPLAAFLRAAWDVRHDGNWLRDNTSYLADDTGHSRYYGFPHWNTTDGEVVMEMDTIGDPARAAIWKQPGYPEWAGRVAGAAIARRLGRNVVDPGPYGLPVAGTPIIGPASASRGQAMELWRVRYAERSRWDEATVGRITVAYWTLGADEGVDPAPAFSQSLKETGGHSFLTAAGTPPESGYSPDQWNFAGIGTTGRGVPGESWPSVEAGVRGHLRRLRMYAEGTAGFHDLEILKRAVPIRLWGADPTFEELGGDWAPNPDYGRSIIQHYLRPLQATVVPTGHFDDVGPGHWAFEDVELLASLNIARGSAVGTFGPGEAVVRAETAALIARTIRHLTGDRP